MVGMHKQWKRKREILTRRDALTGSQD
jgi:hypothetical protein